MNLQQIDIRKDISTWDNFITLHIEDVNYSIAHNPCLSSIFEDVFHYKSEYYLLIENNNIIGILPGFNINGKFVSVPIFPTAGLFVNKSNEKIPIYNKVLERLAKYEIRDYLKISKYFYDEKIVCHLLLCETPELQLQKFKAKLRSQIHKGCKNGISIKIGGKELLEYFYEIYSNNMHKIGSPVLDKILFIKLIENYKNGIAKIFIAYYEGKPIAGSFVLSYGKLFEVGWASTLSEFNIMNPNMVLYWEMIKYSIDQKMKVFSFGRATKGSGSHKFKTQWGIEERQIYFNYSSYQLNIRNLSFLSKLWKILPLEVANKVGPYFRNKTRI